MSNETLQVDKVERAELDKIPSRRQEDSIKGTLFSEFAELEPEGNAISVEYDKDNEMSYIRSLASKFNREEASDDVKIRTKVDKSKKKAYIYATNMS